MKSLEDSTKLTRIESSCCGDRMFTVICSNSEEQFTKSDIVKRTYYILAFEKLLTKKYFLISAWAEAKSIYVYPKDKSSFFKLNF